MAKYDDYDWDELPSEVKAAGKVYLLLLHLEICWLRSQAQDKQVIV